MLALSRPGGIVICNGYKDREYLRLALLGRKLGLETYIVVALFYVALSFLMRGGFWALSLVLFPRRRRLGTPL